MERTRILNFYLENETSLFKNDLKVLHVAPEDCLFKILKKLDIEYVDGDINEANATHLIDLTEIPYSDNYFDLIICSHVLGHIPDEARAIREMKRVLKEDGTALVMTLIDLNSEITFEDKSVNSDQQRLLKYGESDLCRLHGLDFDQRLKSEGFKVEKINYTEKLPKEYAERYQLGDGSRELIFRCTKI
ncbi:class I SAM-dependent methyltransferase [Sunxiuqinia indica]|uniref:class I SAM-dependent methyltransferase n=1 Tax=Sunxiuqinia indica TaxID=2692584 RepID=UPI00135C15CB|nr:class I SAM-dependent methyltransferase [Sunxiuqinia indica]